MEFVKYALTASVLSLAALAGCQSSPVASNQNVEPRITVVSTRGMTAAGESVLITAQTRDLLGSKRVNWTVSPDGPKLSPNGESGQQVLFTAQEPGTYVVQAWVTSPDGRRLSDQTNITVNGTMRSSTDRKSNAVSSD
jgi:hypothetical protein